MQVANWVFGNYDLLTFLSPLVYEMISKNGELENHEIEENNNLWMRPE
jgi:hypothetical protein